VDWLVQHPDSTLFDIEALPTQKASQLSPENLVHPTEEKQHTQQSVFFRVNPRGVFYVTDEAEPCWICSELRIKALVRDKSSENWGRLLEFYDADGELHTWPMPMEMLKGGGEELRGELMRLGLEIATGTKSYRWLTEYIITSKPQMRARCVTRTGWHPPVFVLPDCTIGKRDEIVLYQTENPTHDYKQSGTLESWQKEISLRCIGNSRLMLAVSCAFAGMLLEPAGLESGGIHFVSESSTGKTTVLRVAASVYGAPDYLNRWRATANGLEALAALRSDTLLILDELSQVDPREAGEIAYMLANGSGKARAGKSGHARARAQWRLLFLSAGEISLAQHLQEAGKKAKAGQEVRLVDIPADAGKGMGVFEYLHDFESAPAFSEALNQATTQCYGTPARAFLEKITCLNHAGLSNCIKQVSKKFITNNLPENASGQVHRICERFALIAAAGELASSYGITRWSAGEASQAVSQCFCDWLVQRGGIENQEKSLILSQVSQFFEAHGESRFSDLNGQNTRTINRAGFKKIDLKNETTTYYVMPETFKNEICAGLDYRSVTRTLLIEGWLASDMNNAPYRRERLPGMGQVRCYVFTNKIWRS
jgi:putative DNA primase/helicase